MEIILLIISLLCIYSLILVLLNTGLKNMPPCGNFRTPPVSVIVAAHNEEQLIRRCLMAVIHQNYPSNLYEIIVVDDRSTDNTHSILADIRDSFPQVKIFQTPGSGQNLHTVPAGSKKRALALGIEHASHELLLFTDADCVPPNEWIRTTVACFDEHVGFVAGFSPLIDPGNSLPGKLVQCDSLMAATFAAAGISRNFPLTCTGRNIAYRKSAFKDVKGFTGIMKSLSGDDDLFMHRIHQKTDWKLKYNVSPDAVVPSLQAKTLRQLLTQKQRHISAGKYFPISVKLFYTIIHLTNIGCYLFPGFSLLAGRYQILALMLFVIRLFLNYFFLRTGARIFHKSHLLKYFLLWEIYSLFYNVISAPRALFGKIVWGEK